jgi:hypothetical protein
VPGAGRLVGGTAATASQRRVGHPSRTFGASAFVQRRLGVWAKAGRRFPAIGPAAGLSRIRLSSMPASRTSRSSAEWGKRFREVRAS